MWVCVGYHVCFIGGVTEAGFEIHTRRIARARRATRRRAMDERAAMEVDMHIDDGGDVEDAMGDAGALAREEDDGEGLVADAAVVGDGDDGDDGDAEAKEEEEEEGEEEEDALVRPPGRIDDDGVDIVMDERGRYMPRWTKMELCPEKSSRARKFGTIKDDNWVRPPLEECSMEDFMFDFMRFHHKQGRDWEIVWSAIDRVMIRTGKPMDCLHFYKQVCALGGFKNRNHAKQSFRIMNVFEQLFNYYDNHTLTDIGNRCLTVYEDFFLDYEIENEEDRAYGRCSLCYGGIYQGTKHMAGVLHTCISCEKFYHKHCQPLHRFASCINKGCFAGVPMMFVCNACVLTADKELIKLDEELRLKSWEDSGTYYVRLYELVARRGRRYNASYQPPTRAVETRDAWQARDTWDTA